jgi:hypothetical protein
MRQQRTPEEEQIRQLKIINAQLNPLGAFIRVGFWLAVLLFTLGVLARLCLPGSLFK